MATPSEAEIRTQWVNIVDVLETNRAFADETMFTAGGPTDTLEQSLEGDYLPPSVTAMLAQFRSAHASLVSPQFARFALEPVVREYGRILSAETGTDGFGAGYRDLASAFRALQDYFRAKSYTVESRAITCDTAPTPGGSNVGDGTVSRLTVDENGDNLEFCHVERKLLRCRSDQNTGAFEEAEVFECLGSQSTPDGLQRAVSGGPNSSHLFGSGAGGPVFLTSRHAGSGRGGTLLQNSSFSTFSSGAPSTWTITYTGDGDANDLSQNTTTVYRGHPGASTNASLEIIASSGGTITLTQALSSMRRQRIDPDTPYFLRLMYHRTGGSGTDADGTLKIRMGTNEKTVTLSAQTGWNELVVDFDGDCWPRNFNEDPFAVDLEWDGATAGATLLIDDVIFCPWDLWDGTYWCIRGNDATHVPWLVDDILEVSDSGGLPATGKLQYWLWLAGFGYLPEHHRNADDHRPVMTEQSELWAAVEASYDDDTIAQLTNVNSNAATGENDTIGLDAASEAIALWDVYAQVDYDSTNATHVAVGKYAVIAILRSRGGTIEGVAQASWEAVFGPEGMIAKVRNTGPRAHAAPLSSSDRKRQSELIGGSKRKQWSDPMSFTDNLPRGAGSE